MAKTKKMNSQPSTSYSTSVSAIVSTLEMTSGLVGTGSTEISRRSTSHLLRLLLLSYIVRRMRREHRVDWERHFGMNIRSTIVPLYRVCRGSAVYRAIPIFYLLCCYGCMQRTWMRASRNHGTLCLRYVHCCSLPELSRRRKTDRPVTRRIDGLQFSRVILQVRSA